MTGLSNITYRQNSLGFAEVAVFLSSCASDFPKLSLLQAVLGQIKPARNPTLALPPPDGLLTPTEAARKLRCSVKTLNAYVAAGEIGYVAIGHGRKRPRRMFTAADIDQFIANQSRKDSPCPSTASRARHTGISTSTGEVIDFRGPRRPPPSGKPKR